MTPRANTPALVTLIVTLFAASSAQAQLISDWFNVKAIDYNQTSAAGETINSGNAYSWEHFFALEAGDTVVSANVTIPSGTLSPLTLTEDDIAQAVIRLEKAAAQVAANMASA